MHVVWLAFHAVTWSLHERGIDIVARSVNGRAKVFALAFEAVVLDLSSTLLDFHEGVLRVVRALPLTEAFVLVDDSHGLTTALLWQLRPRLQGFLVLNVIYIFGAD